jgi:hypothetical protein
MILFDKYKKAIELHKKNNDLFIIKSYIRDDDINSTKAQREFVTVKNKDESLNQKLIKKNNDYDFDKSICRHRYTYICELDNFILRDKNLYFDIVLSVRIKKVIDNPMNIPEIYENNILKFIIMPQYMRLSITDVAESFSMFYKKIKNNKIYCKNGKLNPFTETKGYYYMQMELYKK